jgi:hypothetical protein
MRVSNWTEFARLYSDPANPDAGPFMSGAYLAHAVYGYFQNGGGLAWIVRVGSDGGGTTRSQAVLPAASNRAIEAFRAVAQDGVDGDITLELTQEAPPPKPEGEVRARARSRPTTAARTAWS